MNKKTTKNKLNKEEDAQQAPQIVASGKQIVHSDKNKEEFWGISDALKYKIRKRDGQKSRSLLGPDGKFMDNRKPRLFEGLAHSDPNKKIEEAPASEVSSKETQASEGFIRDTVDQSELEAGIDSEQFTRLPATPPKLWQGGKSGRPKPGETNSLVLFLREVYGPYFPRFRDELRDYIFRNDRKLYVAITNFERRNHLPEDVALPTRGERVVSRLQRAAAQGGFEGMSNSEKRSVMGRLKRDEKRGPS